VPIASIDTLRRSMEKYAAKFELIGMTDDSAYAKLGVSMAMFARPLCPG
jgi:hypothetical protein